jgi:hypothetical protein
MDSVKRPLNKQGEPANNKKPQLEKFKDRFPKANLICRRLGAKMDNFDRMTRLPQEDRQNILDYAAMLASRNKKGNLGLLASTVDAICNYGEPHDRSYFNLVYLNRLLGSQRFIDAPRFVMVPVAMIACQPRNRDLLYFHLDSIRTIADDNFLSAATALELCTMAMGNTGNDLSMKFHELIIRLRAERKKENMKSGRELGKTLKEIDHFEKSSRNPNPPIMVKEKKQA